jgi:hypothetical protein
MMLLKILVPFELSVKTWGPGGCRDGVLDGRQLVGVDVPAWDRR